MDCCVLFMTLGVARSCFYKEEMIFENLWVLEFLV